MALREFAGTLALLCAYGFFKELKPSEPFLTEYLTCFKEISDDDLIQKVRMTFVYP